MQPVPSDADFASATLKIVDLTQRFSVTRATIYRWIKEQGFPKPVRLNGRVVRWNAVDIDAWYRSRPGAVE